VGTRSAPGVGQQQEGQQSGGLGLLWHQLVEQAREPDCLGAEIAPLQGRSRARRVALVEDEIQHVQHDAEPVGALAVRRQREGQTRGLDALLCPADPLGQGWLGDQKRVRDLGRRQPTDRAQGEGELGGDRQRRMAAQEQQRQRVVPVRGLCRARRLQSGRGLLPALPGAFAAPVVDQASRSDGGQPGARLVR